MNVILRRVLVVFSALWIATSAYSQATPASEVINGCGSGAFAFLVPNKTYFSGCEFKQACDVHDLCYSRCETKGTFVGDLVGSTACDDPVAASQRRSKCDDSLRENIVEINPGKSICSMYGAIYRFAVQAIGKNFFKGAIAKAQQVYDIKLPLMNFISYMAHQPGAFKPEEVAMVFDKIGTLESTGVSYRVEFSPSTPRLIVRKDGQAIVDLLGVKD
jgi:hypothetical protein